MYNLQNSAFNHYLSCILAGGILIPSGMHDGWTMVDLPAHLHAAGWCHWASTGCFVKFGWAEAAIWKHRKQAGQCEQQVSCRQWSDERHTSQEKQGKSFAQGGTQSPVICLFAHAENFKVLHGASFQNCLHSSISVTQHMKGGLLQFCIRQSFLCIDTWIAWIEKLSLHKGRALYTGVEPRFLKGLVSYSFAFDLQDSLILAGVIAVCTLFILIYWLRK